MIKNVLKFEHKNDFLIFFLPSPPRKQFSFPHLFCTPKILMLVPPVIVFYSLALLKNKTRFCQDVWPSVKWLKSFVKYS